MGESSGRNSLLGDSWQLLKVVKQEITEKTEEDSTIIDTAADTEEQTVELLENAFKCEVCKKRFEDKQHLKQHEITHNTAKATDNSEKSDEDVGENSKLIIKPSNAENVHACQFCEQKFTFKKQLCGHLKTHSKKKYECSFCERYFSSMNNLKKHMITHDADQPYKCKICDKEFKLKFALASHLASHANKCEVCDQEFPKAKELKTHMKKHNIQCTFCKLTFLTKAHLKKHELKHAGKDKFKCEICETTFTGKTRLQNHSRIHQEGSFKCNTCGKVLRNQPNYEKHCKSHTALKPFKCNVCAKEFESENSFKSHFKMHTIKYYTPTQSKEMQPAFLVQPKLQI